MEPAIIAKLKKNLLAWIVLAIVAGALLGKILPTTAIVPFATFNDVFGKFLGFSVPLIIVGLVTPAIADLGKSGGRWVILTVGLGYISTILAGLGTWGLASLLYPSFLAGQEVPDLAEPEERCCFPHGCQLQPTASIRRAHSTDPRIPRWLWRSSSTGRINHFFASRVPGHHFYCY